MDNPWALVPADPRTFDELSPEDQKLILDSLEGIRTWVENKKKEIANE